jgi:hypothetical protein
MSVNSTSEIAIDWADLEPGIQTGYHGQIRYYRAISSIYDPEYPGPQGPIHSAVFEACDQADVVPVDANTFINPMQEQRNREIAAAVARSHMRKDQAALSDMRKLVKELDANLMYPYKAWQAKMQRHRDRLDATATLRDQIDTMLLDVGENGMIPEYQQFIDQIKMLLK